MWPLPALVLGPGGPGGVYHTAGPKPPPAWQQTQRPTGPCPPGTGAAGRTARGPLQAEWSSGGPCTAEHAHTVAALASRTQ